MAASLSSQQFKSTHVSFSALMVVGEAGWSSSHSSFFYSSAIFKPTWPNSLFRTSNHFQQNSRHRDIEKLALDMFPFAQAFFTISSYFGSFSHMDSNLKIFCLIRFCGFMKKCNESGEWSNAEHVRWKSLASWNCTPHASKAKALSSLSLIWPPSALW